MLEAKDVDNIEKFYPFRGAIVDAYFQNKNADVTLPDTSYLDILSYLYRKCELTGWREQEFQELKKRIQRFKT